MTAIPQDVQDMISKAQALRSFRLAGEAEKKAAEAQGEALYLAELNSYALIGLPEELQPYAQVFNDDKEYLVVDVPGLAKMSANLYTHTHMVHSPAGYRRAVEEVTITTPWRVMAWQYDDEAEAVVEHWAAFCVSLDEALLVAAEIGPERGRPEAEARMKAAQEAQASAAQASQPQPSKPVFYCPLLKGDCLGDQCAWYCPGAGCAVYSLAATAESWAIVHS